MPRNEEYDWIFDFVLQFLESDKFDAAVMDFVDEKCFVFEEEDENKLIYTDIHREFCEHVEALISSNLNEVGISNDQFLESCEKARSGRDINATVFERLVAMDDFQTFKKIMTKRNTELQLEAIRTFKVNTPFPTKSVKLSTKSNENESKTMEEDEDEEYQNDVPLMDPEDLRALKEAEINELEALDAMQEEELQELLFQSLMEMELIHRQEELEHAELERALMLSLVAEEERLRAMMMEAKLAESEVTSSPAAAPVNAAPADAKSEPAESKQVDSDKAAFDAYEKASSSSNDHKRSSSSSTTKKAASTNSAATNNFPDSFADIKPLKPLKGELKPLPLPSMRGELLEKKKETEDLLRKSAAQLTSQRKNEEELRSKLAGLDPDEVERRAKHMKEQRELLLAKKKAEREKKVQAEEERKRKAASEDDASNSMESPSKRGLANLMGNSASDASNDLNDISNEEIAEMRRATMRMALARRLKMDLVESEEAKVAAIQETQFSELDKKLKQVEQLREDNRKREYILAKQLERQQEQIARNIELSAVQMSRNRDD